MKLTLNVKVEKDEQFIEARGIKRLCEITRKAILKTTLCYFAGEDVCAKFWFYTGFSKEPFYKLAIYSDGRVVDMSQIRTLPEVFISKVSYGKNIASLSCADSDDCIKIAHYVETKTRSEEFVQGFYTRLPEYLDLALINTNYLV